MSNQTPMNALFKPQLIIQEINDSTSEAIVPLARSIEDAKFAGINIIVQEAGMYLRSGNKNQKQFFDNFLSYYDCKIPVRITKSEGTSESIEGIPVNVLMYADYTLFFEELKKSFETTLATGLARRLTTSFQDNQKEIFQAFSDAEERQLRSELKTLGKQLFEIFEKIPQDACYKLLPETKEIYNEYAKATYEILNKEENILQKREIKSRSFKALKTACRFASLNHPDELTIKPYDMEQAINQVNFLSKDFKKFNNYRPKTPDIYDKLYNFFKDNQDKSYTKTELIKIFRIDFGIARDKLRQKFDYFMDIIQENAASEGYILNRDTTACKNGCKYQLIKQNAEPLNSDTRNLEDILND